MRDSLFSAIRIVAMMLAVDGKVQAKERAWFMAVMNSFGATFMQRRVLRVDLEGRTPEDLKTLYSRITEEQDRQRLLNFLKVAMRIDGVIDRSETEFLQEVKALIENVTVSTDYADLAQSILNHDKDVQVWKALGDAGRIFSEKRYGPYWGFVWNRSHYSVELTMLMLALAEIYLFKKRSLWILVFIFLILLLMYVSR